MSRYILYAYGLCMVTVILAIDKLVRNEIYGLTLMIAFVFALTALTMLILRRQYNRAVQVQTM